VTGYKGFFLMGDILGEDSLFRLEALAEKVSILLASPGQIVFIEGRINSESIGFLVMACEIIEECAKGALKCNGVDTGDRMIGDKDDLKMDISRSDEDEMLWAGDPALPDLIEEETDLGDSTMLSS